ncbi:MAG: 50S ribosomal protein L3 [Methermicoccaceae archaeon]
MGDIRRPRRGSLAFSPRKRAKSETPRISSWPTSTEPKLLGFAGYKAGMTHVMMIDDKPHSPTAGMMVSVPATVIEAPPLRVVAVRGYESTTHGYKAAGEVWASNLDDDLKRVVRVSEQGADIEGLRAKPLSDIRVIVATQPSKVSGVPKKKPELMEMGVGGADVSSKLEYAYGILGSSIPIADVFSEGELVDTIAITTGKGTQGPVKRWGTQMQKSKHSRTGKLRHIGTLGPWHPHYVRWTVPQLGQTGYHQRTEYNKRILKVGENGEDITPAGGFLHYGVVRNSYLLVQGSVPGPIKRLVCVRAPIRPKAIPEGAVDVRYVSVSSKQGV